MKSTFMLLALVTSVLFTCAHADAKQGFQAGTVVSVERHETTSNYVGGNPTDAPLQAEVYSYDVGIRLNCTVYVARYESALDYLPTVFAPSHAVDVNLQKHVLVVSLPGDREVKLGIGSHSRVKDSSCTTTN